MIPCVFKQIIFWLRLTDANTYILVGPSMPQIDCVVKSMQTDKENCVLTDEGEINASLEIEIIQFDAKRFKISQPFVTDQIINSLEIDTSAYGMIKHQLANHSSIKT